MSEPRSDSDKATPPQSLALGIFQLICGLFFAAHAWRYPLQDANGVGPGYFPLALGLLLAGIGATVLVRALRCLPAGATLWPASRSRRIAPLVPVLLSLCAFAASIETLGLFLSTMLTTLIASTAHRDQRWRSAGLHALLMAALCCTLFVVLLKLQLPVWPGFLATAQG